MPIKLKTPAHLPAAELAKLKEFLQSGITRNSAEYKDAEYQKEARARAEELQTVLDWVNMSEVTE